MRSVENRESRLNFRLSSNLKHVIEEAAAALGQSVSDYAISTLMKSSRDVLRQRGVTDISERDRDRFIAALDDTDLKPNKALSAAARRYKKQAG